VTDQELMQSIKTKYGADLAQVCANSSVPASFLAAMIANESGGAPLAKRFEPAVLLDLWQVLLGRKAAYGSIGRGDLVTFVADLAIPTSTVPATLPNNAFQSLDDLANSWGLTQIMGYHCLDKSSAFARPEDLKDPVSSIRSTIWLLTQFAAQFSLDLATDFEALLRCWNTGRQNGVTYDPLYVPNALQRKALYEALP